MRPRNWRFYLALRTNGSRASFLATTLSLLASIICPRAATFTVTTTADSGPGSLRQAILDSNLTPGSNLIQFSIPGGGVQTILPLTVLPDITNRVTIDGYSQPGARANDQQWSDDATLMVRLDGRLLGGLPTALTLRTSGSLIRGLVVVRFAYGIQINSGQNNVIAGNWIGLDVDNIARGVTFDGVTVTCPVFLTAMFNTIGGSAPADRNIISGNGNTGVSFPTTTAALNSVLGNFIGTDQTGTLPRGNRFAGVSIQAATNILVAGNVLSACTGAGGSGVSIVGGSGDVIRGNLIGLAATGIAVLGNSGDGISVNGASKLQIGGPNAGDGNRIGGNFGNGVMLLGGFGSSVSGNNIGSDSTGALALGNTLAGINLQSSSTNQIGGLGANALNLILFNGGAGVAVTGGVRNDISGNHIFDNGGLGIDLGNDGVSTNDPGDGDSGPNFLQNYPVLTGATNDSTAIEVLGTLDSLPDTTFRIEFYLSSPWDSQNIAEGEVLLGTMSVTTDDNGHADLAFVTPPPAWLTTNYVITATATDSLGNTSEFSAAIPITVIPPEHLSLSASGGGGLETISWPSTASGYVLESTTSLEVPVQWVAVTNGIVQNGQAMTYTTGNPLNLPAQFFRLHKAAQ